MAALLIGRASFSPSAAVPPEIGNARVQEIRVSGDLREQVGQLAAQQGRAWIGYEVPLVSDLGGICCRPGAPCKLEQKAEQTVQRRTNDGPAPRLRVLLRADQGRIGEVRAYSTDCALDAANLPVFWLQEVRPKDSVALLSSLVTPEASGETVFKTILAIGAHAGPAADEALLRFIRTGPPEARKDAVMQLGNARGPLGFETARDLLLEEKSPEIREQALFAVALSPQPGAEDLLLRTARGDRDAAMRSRALLLYTGRVSDRALPLLSELVAGDDPELRSAALLAMMQLPEATRREALKDLELHSTVPEVRHRAELLLKIAEGRSVLPDHLKLAN